MEEQKSEAAHAKPLERDPFPVDYRRLGEGDEAFGRNLGRGLNLLNILLRECEPRHYYVFRPHRPPAAGAVAR